MGKEKVACNSMDINVLKVFVGLAERLHFARTSEEHHISPSTLSRMVKRLEADVGAQLFERNNRTVQLTAAGRDFLSYSQDVLMGWDKLQAKLQSQSSERRGALSLYCSVTASHSVLADILGRLANRHPGIELKLHTGDQAQSLQRLQSGLEDMVIAARPLALPADVAFLPLARSPLVFIGPSKKSNLRDKLHAYEGRMHELPWQDIPFIMAEQGLMRKHTDAWFKQQGVKPRLYAQVAGHEPMVSMVGLACGMAVVPTLVLHGSPVRGSIDVLDIKPRLPDFEIGLCTLNRRLDEPLISAVWSAASIGTNGITDD